MQVILTTENPKYKKLLDIDNKDLMMMIENLGEKCIPVEGCYGGVKENSVLVELKNDNNFEILVSLATLAGQDSIFIQEYGLNYILYTNGINRGKAHDGKGVNVSEHPIFEDNYTKIRGMYYQYHIDFEDTFDWWK